MTDGEGTSRRGVVQSLAGVLATVGFAGALLGGATIGAPAEAATLDGSGWVARLEAEMAALDGGVRSGPVAELLNARGHRPDLLPRVTRGLAVASAFRDLPHDIQRDDAVQELMWREAPGMARSLFELSDVLEGLTADERDQIGRALSDDPGLLADVDTQIERSARRRGVSEGRRSQLRSYTGAIGWRLRRQRPTQVIDETLRRMDKACSKFGFARADWRTVSTSDPRPSGREGRAAAHADPVTRAGLIMLGIAGGITGTGLLLFLVGAATASGLTVIGILLVLVGLIVAAVAGIVLIIGAISSDEEDAKVRLEANPPPAPAPAPAPAPIPEPAPLPDLAPAPG